MPKPNKWSVWSAKYGRTPTWHKTKEAAVDEKDWLNHTMKLKPGIGEEFMEMGWTEVKTRNDDRACRHKRAMAQSGIKRG